MTVPAPDDPQQVQVDLSQRRNRLLLEGDAAAQEQDYDRAIERYLVAALYDALGPYRPVFDNMCRKTGHAFDQRFAFVAPNVLRRIAKCANAGEVELFVIQLRFIDLAAVESQAIAHLHPPLSPEQAWSKIEERLRNWLTTDAR